MLKIIATISLLFLTSCNETYWFNKGAAVSATIQRETEDGGVNSDCIIHIYISANGSGAATDIALRAKLLTKNCEASGK